MNDFYVQADQKYEFGVYKGAYSSAPHGLVRPKTILPKPKVPPTKVDSPKQISSEHSLVDVQCPRCSELLSCVYGQTTMCLVCQSTISIPQSTISIPKRKVPARGGAPHKIEEPPKALDRPGKFPFRVRGVQTFKPREASASRRSNWDRPRPSDGHKEQDELFQSENSSAIPVLFGLAGGCGTALIALIGLYCLFAIGIPGKTPTAVPKQVLQAKDQATEEGLPPVQLASVRLNQGPTSYFDLSQAWVQSSGAVELSETEITDVAILENEAQINLQAFIEAPGWKQKSAFVMNLKDVISDLREYYEDGASDPLYNASNFSYPDGFLTEENIQANIMALVGMHQGERMVFFFKDGKLDWESYVQLKDKTLEKFCSNISTGVGEFRVRMKLGQGKKKPVLHISNLVPGNVWTSELPRNSQGDNQLVTSLLSSDRDRTGIIRLAWEEKNGGYRIVIQRILALDFLN